MIPPSASTVNGAVCEAFLFTDPVPDRSRLARGWPPIPTPPTGRASNASSVIVTRRERELVTSFTERPWIELAAYAPEPSAATPAHTRSAIRSR